jgi:hypothetical protein
MTSALQTMTIKAEQSVSENSWRNLALEHRLLFFVLLLVFFTQ